MNGGIRIMANIKLILGGVLMALVASKGVSNYNEKEASINEASVQYGLTADEDTAFRTCNQQVKNLQINIGRNIKGASVPLDICACQSKTMVKVMKTEQYSGHKNVVDYMTENSLNVEQSIPSSDLKNGLKSKSAFKTLHTSLKECVSTARVREVKRINDTINKPKKNYRQICRRNDLSKVTIKFCDGLRAKGKI